MFVFCAVCFLALGGRVGLKCLFLSFTFENEKPGFVLIEGRHFTVYSLVKCLYF